MSGTILELRGVAAGYNGKTVLNGVDLDVCADEFLGIVGPNGGGKTTLLKVVLGLLKPYAGSVCYMRGGVQCGSLRIGYMPQQAQIDMHFPISVRDVVLSGLNVERRLLRGFTSAQLRREREVEALLGLEDIASRPIGQLSGGQRQRTLLGRAIVSQPEMLVLDEPDAYIDNFFEKKLYSLLKEMNKDCAIILVSHDLAAVRQHAKRTVLVDHKLTPDAQS